jgi:hypothetical protein
MNHFDVLEGLLVHKRHSHPDHDIVSAPSHSHLASLVPGVQESVFSSFSTDLFPILLALPPILKVPPEANKLAKKFIAEFNSGLSRTRNAPAELSFIAKHGAAKELDRQPYIVEIQYATNTSNTFVCRTQPYDGVNSGHSIGTSYRELQCAQSFDLFNLYVATFSDLPRHVILRHAVADSTLRANKLIDCLCSVTDVTRARSLILLTRIADAAEEALWQGQVAALGPATSMRLDFATLSFQMNINIKFNLLNGGEDANSIFNVRGYATYAKWLLEDAFQILAGHPALDIFATALDILNLRLAGLDLSKPAQAFGRFWNTRFGFFSERTDLFLEARDLAHRKLVALEDALGEAPRAPAEDPLAPSDAARLLAAARLLRRLLATEYPAVGSVRRYAREEVRGLTRFEQILALALLDRLLCVSSLVRERGGGS